MSTAPDDIDEDDPRLLQVSREYLTELEAGGRPDRQAYLARYPELADALSECLDGIELAQSLKPMPAPPPTEFSGSPLGDFQIVREIGRGGMGVVYEATQLSLGRRVALKVLPFAAALDARQLQRFKNEAHAAAQLHHTNIVPVYAVGCERGVHFYAMQLIEGRSLATVIQELRGTTGVDGIAPAINETNHSGATIAVSGVKTSHRSRRSSESFRSAARIAAHVADALDYAHEAGVVHRDIKPANLMLDARGSVWVTDFGLAQIVADAGVTQTGDLVGTLRYMSPEQAAGRRIPVDHRADVYSLGATLYELLTLQPIFAGDDRASLLQQILNDDPRPLRQWDLAIPVELETIVLKATAKSPGERYASAADMAADLRRFLDERPILARRPTLADRGRKWMRRHPSFVAASVILLVCLLVGLSIFSALVSHEQSLTRAAYQRESQRAIEADARFKLARGAADEMIRLAEEELSDNPFQESLRKRLLETALGYYQEFVAQHEERPDAHAELTLTRDRVKKILGDLAVLKADRLNFLLRESAVLDDLQLTEDQRTRLADLTEQMEQKRRELPDGPRDRNSDHRLRLQMARENEATLATILTPAQVQRLPQIALQCQGPRALHEPDVVNALKLTAEQREQMHIIEAEMTPYPGEGGRRGGLTSEALDQRLRGVQAKILTVLNEQQLTRWQQMIGKPYDGPLVHRGPGFGFPGGQHGRSGPQGPKPPQGPPFGQGPPHQGPQHQGPPHGQGPPGKPRDRLPPNE